MMKRFAPYIGRSVIILAGITLFFCQVQATAQPSGSSPAAAAASPVAPTGGGIGGLPVDTGSLAGGSPAGSLGGGVGGLPVDGSSLAGSGNPVGSALNSLSGFTGGGIGGIAPTANDDTPNASSSQCQGCSCENDEQSSTQQTIRDEENKDRRKITQDFEDAQDYMVKDWYILYVRKAWKLMTEQLITNGANQMMALGSFFDAKEQMDTQRLLQLREAQAHKDYQVSTEMCVAGTMAQHIASTDRRAALASHVLSKRALDRQLGNNVALGVDGPESDSDSRLDQVRNTYCDKTDNLAQMDQICQPGGQSDRINRDIDYARVMNDTPTLDFDLTDTTRTNDEQDVLALANYLYVNIPFKRLPSAVMQTEEGQEEWLRMRTVMARHAVAENSFDSIMGLKAAMNKDYTDNGKLLGVVFQRLGLSQDDAQKISGGRDSNGSTGTALTQPSQYAVLQTLSHAMYQTPSFYVNLYDTPVNVRRKAVAIQAIGLMLDRESFNSELREEGVLSQILEAGVARAQDRLTNAGNLRNGTQKRNEAQ